MTTQRLVLIKAGLGWAKVIGDNGEKRAKKVKALELVIQDGKLRIEGGRKLRVDLTMNTLKLEAEERRVAGSGRVRSREAFHLFPPGVEFKISILSSKRIFKCT